MCLIHVEATCRAMHWRSFHMPEMSPVMVCVLFCYPVFFLLVFHAAHISGLDLASSAAVSELAQLKTQMHN